MQLCYYIYQLGKFKNLNLDMFCKKLQGKCKTAITFAYDVRKKTYNISKGSAQKSASEFDGLRPVCKFLESSNSKRKKSYAQILVFFNFGYIWSNYGQTTYSRSTSGTK